MCFGERKFERATARNGIIALANTVAWSLKSAGSCCAHTRHNALSAYVANDEEACQGQYIKVSVSPNARTYTVSIPGKEDCAGV